MLKNAIKTAIVVTGGAISANMFLLPRDAMAMKNHSNPPDWSAGTMLNNGASEAGVGIRNVDSGSANNWVVGIAKWIIGLAVVCFVLRVVMTAVDRMVLGNIDDGSQRGPRFGQESGFRLSDIPMIGAYPPDVPWKQVWLNFAKNLAIVVGVYLIIELIMGVIMWLIGVTTMESVQ